MATKNDNKGVWAWIILALLVAAICVSIIYYIGWFDNNTHVDTPAGDNVEQQYVIQEANADLPGEADWQNSSHQSLREEIAEPETPTATPPSQVITQ